MNEKLFEKKTEFIKAYEKALVLDDRSNVKDIVLRYDDIYENEIISIFFNGGGRRDILATGNSNYANAKAILEAVYG
jgi:hypothetical protein